MTNLQILNSLPIPHLVFTADGVFRNDAFIKAFGSNFEPWEDANCSKEITLNKVSSGAQVKIPIFWRKIEGKWFAYEGLSYLIGNFVGITFLDVTEKANLEEELRQKNFFFERAEELGRLGSWNSSPDDDGDLKWSPNNYKIFGRDEKTFTPTVANFFETIHPDDREKVKTAAIKAITSGEVYDVKHRIIIPSGEIRWIHEWGQMVQGEGQRPTRFFGVSQDITKRIEDETKLAQINQKYQVLFDSDLIGIFVTGAEGAVTSCNNEYLRMTGFTQKEMTSGMINWKNTIAEGWQRSDEEWAKFHDGGVFPPLEMEYVNREGKIFPVLVGATKLIAENSWIAFAFDLTEMKALQRKISEVERLDALGLLAGGVAHDFNNILGVNMLYLEQILASDISQETKEKLLLVQNNGERARRLVQQLLTFSRNHVREPQPTSLDDVIQGMTDMISGLATEKVSLDFSLKCGESLINIDVAQLEQVVLNLVTNARDAMEKGGRLRIHTSRIFENSTTGLPYNEFLQLKVSDTGIGMDAETTKRVFEPFYSTKEFGKGTGLGLSTVYGIVRQSNGHIRVESERGRGTTFYISFPVWKGSVPVHLPHPVAEREISDAKILVVEDQSELRGLISDILTKRGFSVTQASSGVDALDKYFGIDDFNLIITDVVMPQMSGPTLRQKIGNEVPVLYISGYANNELSRHGVDYEKSHFLSKPFSSAELLNKVYETLLPYT